MLDVTLARLKAIRYTTPRALRWPCVRMRNSVHYSIELPHGGLKQSGNGKDILHLSLNDHYDARRITMQRKHQVAQHSFILSDYNEIFQHGSWPDWHVGCH